jgi:hypothetical protein
MSVKLSSEIITAAIEGFESQRKRLDSEITELRGMLHGGRPRPAAESLKGRRRKMSAAGRRRIAEAQRKRWAATKGASEPAMAQQTKRKRRLSAAGRAAIVAATKRRWALKRAAAGKARSVAAKKAAQKKQVIRNAA